MNSYQQAIYDTFHRSEIKPQQIAEMMGVSHDILSNKVNPNNDRNKLSADELLALQLITGNSAPCRAMALELERNKKTEEPQNILVAALKASAEHGDVIKAIEKSLKDNRLTSREVERCQREIDEAIDALKKVAQSLHSHKNIKAV